ncbi:MAG: IS1634 family transposase [Phycisphaerae bacterium]
MFLRAKTRRKDGKEHRYWSIVENRRSHGGRVVQRQVLYLGEINDSQHGAWCRALDVLGDGGAQPRQMAIFPADREPPAALDCDVVQVRLSELSLHEPRQWGACWLAMELWRQLDLDTFWAPRLPVNRQGTRWLNVFKTLVAYQLVEPGSEWRLHRHWYQHSAMREADYPVSYLVGTPRGRLNKLEKDFLTQPWAEVRNSVHVKLLERDGELYVLARSDARVHKERAMRQRRLKKLWARLHALQTQRITRDELLLKLGAARKEAGRAWALVNVTLPKPGHDVNATTFTFSLNKDKLRVARRREGRYLLRSNLCDEDPAKLWHFYIQLTQVEQAFKELKGDLSIRPIYHQRDERIEAHIFIAFVAYCLQVTLKQRLRALAPGLTPAAVLEKFAAMQMVDVHVPTVDGRELVLSRYTQPDRDQRLVLQEMKLALPKQPPPRIYAHHARAS